MTTMRVVGECFFWYRLTRVFPDRFHRAVKRLCVCVCVPALTCVCGGSKWIIGLDGISLGQGDLYKMPSNAFLLRRL